jgi:catechol 2,3-dioxygenase-like lactoylglutathione lyase family enzyme
VTRSDRWVARTSPGTVSGAGLSLDHLSIRVPDLVAAIRRFDERLGLRVRVTPEAPERHGRIHLDRAYLEVAGGADAPTWDVTDVFLRFGDPERVRAHLEGAGFRYRVRVFEGVDGLWDDVEIEASESMPILVRRTAPAEVARDWPPALDRPHRCGAFTLAAVHLPVRSVSSAADVYARLLGVEAPRIRRRRAAFRVGSATIVLVEGDERGAVVLGVASLERSRAALGPVLMPTDRGGVAWLNPAATEGLPIGLAEGRTR